MKHSKVAVVAGGSAGIGLAVVQALLKRGYKVGILARGEQRLRDLRQRYGAEVLCISCDVGNPQSVENAASEFEMTLGSINVWVNAAMLTAFSPFKAMPAGEFEKIVQTTFLGQVNGTRAAILKMGSGPGLIVNIGSGLSYRPVPNQSAYSAAKSAISGFSGSIASELKREGSDIAISLVQLPAINTPQFTWARNRMDKRPQPAPPVYAPGVAAEAVLKAIDDRPREIFVGSSVLQLVFGNMLLPAFLDRKMARDGVEMQKSESEAGPFEPGNLDEPVDHPATAEGQFEDEASQEGLMIDADLARKVFFFGGAIAMLALGFIGGAILA